jgi:DNA (cytosine-5)-methyltransferase 1
MRYVSVCSGIEAATVAWHPLGWTPVAFSEIEKFPSAVRAHHYPDTPNLGDMTQHEQWPIGPGSTDLLVGGTPCQSFSVAGLRKGLADPRGNLALTYLAIADRLRPRWLVWENVPGVLSSGHGRDFGAFLGALVELGYGFAYRVLDARFFGVAQRRRRVFVVGHLGDWRRAAAVLLEQSCLSKDPAESRATGEGIAADVAGSIGQRLSRSRTELDGHGAYVPVAIQGNLIGRDAGGPHGVGASDEGAMYTLTKADVHAVAFEPGSIARNAGPAGESGLAPTLRSEMGDNQPAVRIAMQVRRLTPVECERLQGFPDGYTAIPWRGKPATECPDGPRYRALGNSMAVPCMRWIGERIAQVDAIAV